MGYANGYQTTITAGITSGATTCVVASTTGIPSLPFTAVIAAEGANTDEIVQVTANATGTLTITRAYELTGGNGASAHGSGATFAAVVTAGGIDALAANLGQPLGLTGATAATRYVGATTSGAPASGTFAVGDYVIDQSGPIWVCTVAGTPGTWVAVGRTISGSIGALAHNVGTVTVSSATDTPVACNTTDFDTSGFHSTVSNTSRMTIPAGLGGVYVVTASTWGPTHSWNVRFRVNGSTEYSNTNAGSSGVASNNAIILKLNAGDYVEAMIWDTSGGGTYGHASAREAMNSIGIAMVGGGGSVPPAVSAAALVTAYSTFR